MKAIFRIFSYAKPLSRYLPAYGIFMLLGILFSVANFAMIIPMLDVLFDQVDPTQLQALATKPSFAFSLDYILSLFNYYFVDVIQQFGKLRALLFICMLLISSVFLTNFFRYLAGIVTAHLRTKLVRNIRYKIYESVSRLHIGFFTNEKRGDLISRMSNDMHEVELTIMHTLRSLIREPLTITVYFLVLFVISVKLTVFTLVLLPITGGVIAEIIRRLKKKAIQSQESLGRIISIVDETLGGMRVIKAFTAERFIRRKFYSEIDHHKRVNLSMAYKNELSSPLSEVLGVMVVAGILYYGGSLVLDPADETLSASQFITYIAIYSQILNPSKAFSKGLGDIQKGLASSRRIFEVIDSEPTIKDKPDAKELPAFESAIEFKDVSFSYGGENVLKNIDLRIEKGQTVALVGQSGGGKSTLADLVPRFYDPTEGSVEIDGISLKEYSIESLRRQMGIVTQESILFNDTIYNNIAFGVDNPRDEDVEKAAKIANAHDFIMDNEQGYQTVIGERGTKLSGGQRQRLSIARAILKNPQILVLDEATSALDSESEKLVQQALNKLMEHRTSIVIAHRLSTIQHADEIIVIQDGKIMERGTHDDLISQQGVYQKLSTIQGG